MKTSVKRATALALASVMALSVTACGSSSSETTAATTAAATTAAATTAAETTAAETTTAAAGYELGSWAIAEDPESVTGSIVFAIPFKGTQGMDQLIEDFNAIYPNVEVELNTYSNTSDGNTALNTAIVAGEVDVVASFGLSATYKRWSNDLYIPLTDYIEKYGIDLVAEWGTDAYTYDGVYYTFPCGGLSYYIAINLDEWDAAGLSRDELPTDEWTWDDYLKVSAAMTHGSEEDGTKVYGGSSYHSVNYFMYDWCQVYGHDMYYTDDSTQDNCEVNFTDDLIVNSLARELQAENVDKIWFPDSVYRSDSIQAQVPFMNGQTASTIIPNVTRFVRDTETYPHTFVTYFAPWPVEEAGQTNYMSGVSTFSHAGITSTCSEENMDAAWAFLAYYSTYGSKYLAMAGHLSAWKGTDNSAYVEMLFGSEEEAAKLIDVDSYKRVVVNYENPSYVETITTAYSDVSSAINTYALAAMNGEYADQGDCTAQAKYAMELAKADADAAIAKALGK